MTLNTDELFETLKSLGEKRDWHLKYAKFNRQTHQSLLAHSLNVSSLSHSLLDYLEEKKVIQATDKLRIQVLLTGFLHDAGKERQSYQKAVLDYLNGTAPEPLDFGHQQDKDIRPIIESMQQVLEDRLPSMTIGLGSLWDEIMWSVSQMGQREDAASISQSFRRAPSNDSMICKEIVHVADIMMSKLDIQEIVTIPLEGSVLSKLQLVYSRVGTVRGILTQFLHAALENQFSEAGFRPIQWFPDGTVYVGSASVNPPQIDSTRLVDEIAAKIRSVLDNSSPLQVAKASYGNLTAQVIAAPEFLFANKIVMHEFWQYISRQNFAKFASKNQKDLKDTEKIVFSHISDELSGKDESTRLIFLGRFLADFNLLIILFAIRKQLVEKARDTQADIGKIEEEATKRIHETLSQVLKIPVTCYNAWPEIALQTKAESRLPVAKTLWLSTYYNNPTDWHKKFLEALERSTAGLAEFWQRYVPDKYAAVASLLLPDVLHPIDPKAILEEVGNLNDIIAEGKTGHGTPMCQKCGAVAVCEAQAELFGKSQIYHDHLIAAVAVAPGNKIQVCELCEFEEKLRSVFMTRGRDPFYTFYIFPHLAMSRNQQADWQKAINEINYPSQFFPLVRIDRWAERVLENGLSSSSLAKSGPFHSEKELAWAIQQVSENNGLEDDLSSMIEPPLESKDSKTVASYVDHGKCKLKERYERETRRILSRLEPVYLSPNFVLLLTPSTVANRDEPESSAAIKWLFFQLLLARIFSASVISGDSMREVGAMLGYTTVPSNIALKSLVGKLGARKGWIPILGLDQALKKLSALILTARELSNAKAGYGNATLLRLLYQEPGQILARISNRNHAYPKRLISYLDAWNDG